MGSHITFFMRSAVDEPALLDAFERITGLVCCSLEFPKDSAQAVVMPLEYSEGFRFAATLAWHASLRPAASVDEMAQWLAEEFDAEVLFEAQDSISDTEREKWRLASPAHESPRSVQIKELPDGICLVTDV